MCAANMDIIELNARHVIAPGSSLVCAMMNHCGCNSKRRVALRWFDLYINRHLCTLSRIYRLGAICERTPRLLGQPYIIDAVAPKRLGRWSNNYIYTQRGRRRIFAYSRLYLGAVNRCVHWTQVLKNMWRIYTTHTSQRGFEGIRVKYYCLSVWLYIWR